MRNIFQKTLIAGALLNSGMSAAAPKPNSNSHSGTNQPVLVKPNKPILVKPNIKFQIDEDEEAEAYIEEAGKRPEPNSRPDTGVFGQKLIYDLIAYDQDKKQPVRIPSGSVIEYDPNNKSCGNLIGFRVTYDRIENTRPGKFCANISAVTESLRDSLITGKYIVAQNKNSVRNVTAPIQIENTATRESVTLPIGSQIRYRPDIKCWGIGVEVVSTTLPNLDKKQTFCVSQKWFSAGTEAAGETDTASDKSSIDLSAPKAIPIGIAKARPVPSSRYHVEEDADDTDTSRQRSSHSGGKSSSQTKQSNTEATADNSGKSSSSDSTAFNSQGATIKKEWLDGRKINLDPSQLNSKITSDMGNVHFFVPTDRCKAGILQFGNSMCMVLARGVGNSSASRSMKGKTRSGSDCYYAPESSNNGATPIDPPPAYKLGLEGTRSNTTSYGKHELIGMYPINSKGERIALPGKRDLLRVHSGREGNGNIEARPTRGCLRIDPKCQIAFNEWVRAHPRALLKVEEVAGINDAATNDQNLLYRVLKRPSGAGAKK